MVLVKQDAVVVLATSITATARVLAVLANAAVAGTDVTALLAVLPEPCSRQGIGVGVASRLPSPCSVAAPLLPALVLLS